jgi:hypothetical protein
MLTFTLQGFQNHLSSWLRDSESLALMPALVSCYLTPLRPPVQRALPEPGCCWFLLCVPEEVSTDFRKSNTMCRNSFYLERIQYIVQLREQNWSTHIEYEICTSLSEICVKGKGC